MFKLSTHSAAANFDAAALAGSLSETFDKFTGLLDNVIPSCTSDDEFRNQLHNSIKKSPLEALWPVYIASLPLTWAMSIMIE